MRLRARTSGEVAGRSPVRELVRRLGGGLRSVASLRAEPPTTGWIRRRLPVVDGAFSAFRWLRVCLAGAPASLGYVGVLCGTWWVLRSADPALVHQFLVSQSTNWHNMARQPVRVLLVSPFWSESTSFPGQFIVEFLLVMVAAERWLGTRRWLLTFAAGHVGATLATVAWIGYAVDHGLLGPELVDVVDVGGSYGFYAVAAQLTYRLPGRRARRAWVALLVAYLLVAAVQGGAFTDYGHLVALTIGFGLYRRSRLRASAADVPRAAGSASLG